MVVLAVTVGAMVGTDQYVLEATVDHGALPPVIYNFSKEIVTTPISKP